MTIYAIYVIIIEETLNKKGLFEMSELTKRSYLAAENFKKGHMEFRRSAECMISNVQKSNRYVFEKSKIVRQKIQNILMGGI